MKTPLQLTPEDKTKVLQTLFPPTDEKLVTVAIPLTLRARINVLRETWKLEQYKLLEYFVFLAEQEYIPPPNNYN